MIYTDAEIMLLRLCGWCKDLPIASSFLDNRVLYPLLYTGLLRISRNKQSIRVTDSGNRVLESIGHHYEKDNTVRSAGARLNKRLNTANLMLFLLRLETDVFLCEPPVKTANKSFFPSFVPRRRKDKNLLGTSRFSGLLYSGDTASAVYYIPRENDGLYPDTEKNTFTMSILTGGRKSAALFTGADDLSEIIVRAKNKTTKSRALTVMQAIEKLDYPVSFVPMSGQGLRQLRILMIPDYKQRLIRTILKKEYAPPERRFYDGIRKTDGKYFMVGIDFDIPRMHIVSEYGAHIILLDWQMEAAKRLLSGRKAVLHPVTAEWAESVLGIPNELPKKANTPYLTREGEYINASFKISGKG